MLKIHANRWTRRRILTAAYAILRRPDTEIRLRDLNANDCVAKSSWKIADGQAHAVKIVIDPNTEALVRAVIHELEHVILEPYLLAFTPALQEVAFQAWDSYLFDHIAEKEMAKWRRAIRKRMKGVNNAQ